MIWIRKVSGWTFVTSATAGVGLEFVAGSGGAITLADPARKIVTLHYGGLGVGLSDSFRLPKVGKIKFAVKGKGVGAGLAPAQFPNAGVVLITESFAGEELGRSNLQGATVFVEGGLGLIGGGAASAMLMGINPFRLAAALAMPGAPLLVPTLMSAPAILLTAGLNVGLQAGGGVAVFGGYLW